MNAGRLRQRLSPSRSWLWYLLPAFLIAHAVAFWGRGVVEEESLLYIQKYLTDQPLLATVFDPNDASLYQARELSYLVDIADARFLAWLADRGVVLFVPLSGVLGLVALAWLFVRGARRVQQLDVPTSALLLSLFVSCIVIQASTPIFYRSAKILLTVLLVAFLFRIVSLITRPNQDQPIALRHLAVLALLGFAMSLCDRQGFFFLIATALTLVLLGLAALARREPGAADRWRLAGSCATAIAAATVYGYVVAPWAISTFTGTRVTFSYQQRSFTDFGWAVLSDGGEMFRAQVSYLFGNIPFAFVFALAVAVGVLALWRHRSVIGPRLLIADAGIVGAAVIAAPILLLAVLILYHRPVYSIPDHAFWYYTIPIQALFVFGLTLLISRVNLGPRPRLRRLAHAVLAGMIVSNVLHYSAQRHFMIESPYFREQYDRTRQILANEEDARSGKSVVGRRPWLRVESSGAVVSLPIEDEAFVEVVRAAYATFRHRDPLRSAPGPHWSRLHEFLSNSPALFEDPESLRSVVDGLRSVGVRRIELHVEPANSGASARAMADALRAAEFIGAERAIGGVQTFELDGYEYRTPDTRRTIPSSRLVATASRQQMDLARAFDGDASTYWTSGVPQTGDEWIQIDFAEPVDVGCIGLRFNATNPGRNPPGSPAAPGREVFPASFRPRGLVIESRGDDEVRSERFNPLAALMRALLRDPVRPVMSFCLPPNRSRTLVLRQTGRTETDPWKVSELTVWERQ